MEQTPTRIELWQFITIILGVGLLSGIIFGAAIFFLGKRKNNRKLGNIGALVCFLVGFLLGPLPGLLAAIVFAFFILRSKRQTPTESADAAGKQEII